MAKSSTSLDELSRDATTNARRKELMGGSEEQIAHKKAVSFLYIALGEAARKTLLDRKPNHEPEQLAQRMPRCLPKEAKQTYG